MVYFNHFNSFGEKGEEDVWTIRFPWTTSFIMQEPLKVPIPMKCPSEVVFSTNISKLKCSPHVTYEHVQILQFFGESEIRPRFL